MDINKIGQAGIKLDLWFHTLNQKYNKASKTHNWAYGRGLEQASGMGYWFIALTMLFGGGYGVESETIQINNFLWAWMAATLGYCQIYYNGLAQRKVFNLMATTGWITIAISAFVELGGWNLLTAVSLPYCLCSFYLYGFLVGPQGDSEEQ